MTLAVGASTVWYYSNSMEQNKQFWGTFGDEVPKSLANFMALQNLSFGVYVLTALMFFANTIFILLSKNIRFRHQLTTLAVSAATILWPIILSIISYFVLSKTIY